MSREPIRFWEELGRIQIRYRAHPAAGASLCGPHGLPWALFIQETTMPLFQVTDDGLERRPPAAFATLGMYERADL